MAKIDTLFQYMMSVGASDLHMTSLQRPMLRVDGSMTPKEDAAVTSPEEMRAMLKEIAPERNWKEFEETGDADFAYELADVGRFRCNYFMDRNGPGAVFRQIPTKIPTAEQLGLPPGVLKFCHLTKGLVVVTGPTGSGKSTTLAAMVNFINRNREDHLITIEDPIEFVHPTMKCLINQREVGRHTNSFKRALRAALREDPDIVLVGEMRDLETVQIAIETAETGHLVFGTLHTTTAASTVDRIIDQFPTEQQAQIRVMLSESLKGVIAQTLCKKKPKGRVAALEIMAVNSAIASLIREGKTHQITSMMQVGAKHGMRLMNDSLFELVQQGLVDPLEAYMKSVQKDDLVGKLQSKGIHLDLSKLAEGDSGKAPAAGAAPAPTPAKSEPAAPFPSYRPTPTPSTAGTGSGNGKISDPFESFRNKKS